METTSQPTVPTTSDRPRRAETLRKMGEALRLMEEHGLGSSPLRGVVLEVARGSGGQAAGLRLDVGGFRAFIPASESMGLCDMPEGSLSGLRVLVAVTGVDFLRKAFFASIQAAYEVAVSESWYPTFGKVSAGIPLVPQGGQILVLLPRGCRGILDTTRINLTREKWKQACGVRQLFRIGRCLRPGRRPVFAVYPVPRRSISSATATGKVKQA